MQYIFLQIIFLYESRYIDLGFWCSDYVDFY